MQQFITNKNLLINQSIYGDGTKVIQTSNYVQLLVRDHFGVDLTEYPWLLVRLSDVFIGKESDGGLIHSTSDDINIISGRIWLSYMREYGINKLYTGVLGDDDVIVIEMWDGVLHHIGSIELYLVMYKLGYLHGEIVATLNALRVKDTAFELEPKEIAA